MPHIAGDDEENAFTEKSRLLIGRMHKAIAIIQLKLEAQMAREHPEWGLSDRDLLSRIDKEKGTVTLDGKEYPLNDTNFPTLDPADPTAMTDEEKELVDKLRHSFSVSDKLMKHIDCLFSNGCMYGIYKPTEGGGGMRKEIQRSRTAA